jgi:hypothetical protein
MKKRGEIREVARPCGNPALSRASGLRHEELYLDLHAGVVTEFGSAAINNRRGGGLRIRNIEMKGRRSEQERENLNREW